MDRHGRGFTLIEMLVVIAIIALLTGILLPGLKEARAAAGAIKAVVGARSLTQAYTMYTNDHADFVLPAYLTPAQATGVLDEFGNTLAAPASQRWVYRLAPYFDFGWSGTTHVGERAELLEERERILSEPGGAFAWSYEVSVFPSFGINRLYAGGDYRRQDLIDRRNHIKRGIDAHQPSGLIVFASARFYVGPTVVDGYIDVEPPQLGAVYDEDTQTNSPATAYGHVHPRYRGQAASGWLDGHASLLDHGGIADRRNWSNIARIAGDAAWEP